MLHDSGDDNFPLFQFILFENAYPSNPSKIGILREGRRQNTTSTNITLTETMSEFSALFIMCQVAQKSNSITV